MAMPMLSGIVLGFFPYFVDNVWILCGIGAFFVALPFFAKF